DLVSEIEVDTDEPVDLEIADDELEPDADTELENEIYGGPEMLVISNGGIGKRSYVSAYRKTRRGAKGVLNIKLREGELVIAALLVESGEKAMLITERGQVVKIPIDEVRRVGRNSVGVT